MEQSLAAVVEARLEDTRSLLDRTVTAWSCSSQAQPEHIARFWLTEAALASFSANPEGAEEAFVAAKRAAPQLWDDRLGVQLRETWSATPIPEGTGTLTLTPTPAGLVVVDGEVIDGAQLEATEGLHLLQVLSAEGIARFARTLNVVAGQDALVRTGLLAEVAPVEPEEPIEPAEPIELPEPQPDFTRTTPGWLVAAGTAAVLGTAGAIAARSQRSAIQEATTVEDVDRALLQQKVMAGVAYTGAGVAVVSVGLHFGTRKK